MQKTQRHSLKTSYKNVFPHWKVQYYDTLTMCWRVIPKAYPSMKLAETVANRLPVPKVRLIQMNNEKSQIILPEMKKN